jgi:phospholipid/cholesterol/gamma-HCH transport system substrate-binding protein
MARVLTHGGREWRPRAAVPSSAWKTAVFGAVTIVLLGLLATLIGNISFEPTDTYAGRFTDATGVLKGDRVRVAGVEVGSVRDVRIVNAGDGRKHALIEFAVRKDVPVLDSAHLQLRYENIVGQRYLAIEEKAGHGRRVPAGTTFGLDQTSPALNLTELFNGFQPLLRALNPEQMNKLSYEIVRAFQGEASSIGALLRDTASLTSTLADKDAVIGRLVGNLNDVLATIDARDEQLTALVVQFRDLMTGLSSDRKTVAIQLPKLDQLLAESSDFVHDVRPSLASTLAALAKVAHQLGVDQRAFAASLQEIPSKMRMMARTGSYGSWFNFYVCGLEVRLKLNGGTLFLGTPSITSNETDSVCQQSDGSVQAAAP